MAKKTTPEGEKAIENLMESLPPNFEDALAALEEMAAVERLLGIQE